VAHADLSLSETSKGWVTKSKPYIRDMVATTKVKDNAQATTKIRRAFICSLVMRSGRRGGGIMGI
jgi:hypothetical protein